MNKFRTERLTRYGVQNIFMGGKKEDLTGDRVLMVLALMVALVTLVGSLENPIMFVLV